MSLVVNPLDISLCCISRISEQEPLVPYLQKTTRDQMYESFGQLTTNTIFLEESKERDAIDVLSKLLCSKQTPLKRKREEGKREEVSIRTKRRERER